jgi:hypothetical protein
MGDYDAEEGAATNGTKGAVKQRCLPATLMRLTAPHNSRVQAVENPRKPLGAVQCFSALLPDSHTHQAAFA